jgi:hypothetical protein
LLTGLKDIRYKGKSKKRKLRKRLKNLINRRDLDPDPYLDPQLEKISALNQCGSQTLLSRTNM